MTFLRAWPFPALLALVAACGPSSLLETSEHGGFDELSSSDAAVTAVSYTYAQCMARPARLRATSSGACFFAERGRLRACSATQASCVEVQSQSASAAGIDPKAMLRADVNWDGRIDIFDLTTVASAMHRQAGQPGFRPLADVRPDGRIDIFDLVLVAASYNQNTVLGYSPTTSGGTREAGFSELSTTPLSGAELFTNAHGVAQPVAPGSYVMTNSFPVGPVTAVHAAVAIWNGETWVRSTSILGEQSSPGEEPEKETFQPRTFYRLRPGGAAAAAGFDDRAFAERLRRDIDTLEDAYRALNVPYSAECVVTPSFDGNSNTYNTFVLRAIGYTGAMLSGQYGSGVMTRDGSGALFHWTSSLATASSRAASVWLGTL